MSTETRQWLAKKQIDRLMTVPIRSPEFRKGLHHMGDRDAKALHDLIGGPGQVVGGGSLNQALLNNRWSNAICEPCGDFRFSTDGKSIQLCEGCCHTFYCSEQCQEADWSKHKSQCGSQTLPHLLR